jgi:hypothetical protein
MVPEYQFDATGCNLSTALREVQQGCFSSLFSNDQGKRFVKHASEQLAALIRANKAKRAMTTLLAASEVLALTGGDESVTVADKIQGMKQVDKFVHDVVEPSDAISQQLLVFEGKRAATVIQHFHFYLSSVFIQLLQALISRISG